MNTRKRITAKTPSGSEWIIERAKLRGHWAVYFAWKDVNNEPWVAHGQNKEPILWFNVANAIDTIERKWK